MSVGIATMGYFNPAPCQTISPVDPGGIGGEGGGGYYEEKRKPVVIVSRVDENGERKRPTIEITEVETI